MGNNSESVCLSDEHKQLSEFKFFDEDIKNTKKLYITNKWLATKFIFPFPMGGSAPPPSVKIFMDKPVYIWQKGFHSEKVIKGSHNRQVQDLDPVIKTS